VQKARTNVAAARDPIERREMTGNRRLGLPVCYVRKSRGIVATTTTTTITTTNGDDQDGLSDRGGVRDGVVCHGGSIRPGQGV
jgi:hypothetical protein